MDFDNVLEITAKHKKIIAQYQKVHIFLFKYFLFAFLFVFATILFINFSSKTDIIAYEEPQMFSIRKVTLKWQFENFIQENTVSENTEIFVLQGLLSNSGELFQSANNLIQYKWFTMPRYVSVYNTAPLQSITYFNEHSSDYKLSELEIFVRNIIFTRPILTEEWFKRSQIPIEENIVNNFNLSCLLKWKLIYGSCGFYIENFLKNFYVYDIKKDYSGMKSIYAYISKNEKYKNQFCEWLNNYVLYSNDISPALGSMFRDCGTEESFSILQNFINLQKQFDDGYITDEIYYHDLINQYKLFLLQQSIYIDIASQGFNQRTLFTYVSFVQKLLKKDLLQWFYRDETYRFNTYYLKPKLDSSIYDNKRIQADAIVRELNLINKWSELIGFPSLISQITNPNLATQKDNVEISLLDILPNIGINDLLEQIKSYSFFVITQEAVKESSVDIGGYMKISYKNEEIDLAMTAKLVLWENKLLIEEINFKDYPQLTISAQTIAKQRSFTLSQMYQYISENIGLFLLDSSDIDFCDRVNESLSNVSISQCSPQYIELSKKINNKKITYNLTLNDFNIEKIEIDEKEIESMVLTMMKNINTNAFNLYSRLQEIIEVEPEIEDINEVYQSDKNLMISEKIKKYLHVEPENIREKDDQFVIEFRIEQQLFIGIYDFSLNKIEPLYFGNVYIREWKQLVVRNFNLILDDEHKTSINKFIISPLDYIKEINKPAYEAYLRYK